MPERVEPQKAGSKRPGSPRVIHNVGATHASPLGARHPTIKSEARVRCPLLRSLTTGTFACYAFSRAAERLAEVRGRLAAAVQRGGHGQRVTLIAVTKTFGIEAVEAAWGAGIHDVGENRVQEALPKMVDVNVPVRWHLIGHLQRNKAKAADSFCLVHSMDSARLAEALHARGLARGQPIDVLVQVNVAGEASKSGWAPEDVPAEAERLVDDCAGVRVRGVMVMAPLDAPEAVLRATFAGARTGTRRSGDGWAPGDGIVDGNVERLRN